jgi:Tol biopolymer transport system component
MNTTSRLEAELTAFLYDSAASGVPDYTESILARTAGVRQRPRWSLPAAWIPQPATRAWAPVRAVPWRSVAILALMLVLLVASAVYVGNRSALPAPFGRAGNGLVAFSQNGNIYTADPATGTVREIVVGPENDHDPRWSLDGTRLLFLRATERGDVPVVTAADGSGPVVSTGALVGYDPDGMAWSPDGRSVAFVADYGTSRAIYLLDTERGDLTRLDVDYLALEVFWRPPDGRELMFLGGTVLQARLFLFSFDDGSVRPLPVAAAREETLRPGGWTPDGRHFVVHEFAERGTATRVIDASTGSERVVDVAFGHVSNDGTRLVGLRVDGSVCVSSIEGGACRTVGGTSSAPEGAHREGLLWSPDDRWIVSRPATGGRPVLLDPEGRTTEQPSWLSDGIETWQRQAP